VTLSIKEKRGNLDAILAHLESDFAEVHTADSPLSLEVEPSNLDVTRLREELLHAIEREEEAVRNLPLGEKRSLALTAKDRLILEALVSDDSVVVRALVAASPELSRRGVERLLERDDPYLDHILAKNSGVAGEFLAVIAGRLSTREPKFAKAIEESLKKNPHSSLYLEAV
jgi:hypothetical protein